jgi:nicotinate-nucleotide adenylyltransferase
MKKEKIGFFGGCFNPPTNTHIDLANKLIKNEIIERVIFVPVGNYYQKQNLASAEDRYNMLKIATDGYTNLGVEDIDVNSQDKLYAVDTFKLIENKYPDKDIYFIMGADNFQKMPLWKNYNEIIKKYKFVVIERLKYSEVNNTNNNIIYYKTNPTVDISSTQIRNMIACNKDTNQLLNKNVIEYIKNKKLYLT